MVIMEVDRVLQYLVLQEGADGENLVGIWCGWCLWLDCEKFDWWEKGRGCVQYGHLLSLITHILVI